MAFDFGPVLDRVTRQLRTKLEADMRREVENRAMQVRIRRLEGLLRAMGKRIAKVLAEPSVLEQAGLSAVEPVAEPRKRAAKPRRSKARPAKAKKQKHPLSQAHRIAVGKAQKARWLKWRKDHGVPDGMTTPQWKKLQTEMVSKSASA